jgi:hypothetical protein
MQCWFNVSDPTTRLGGMILRQGVPTSRANALHFVNVMGSTSDRFDVPPGTYRYEFEIETDAKFDLTLFVDGARQDTEPSEFDPQDEGMGDAARVGRVALFTVG